MNTLTLHKLATFTRNGLGGSPVHVVVEPEPLSAIERLALSRELQTLTAFIPYDTPDPLPVTFFDPAGERDIGEQALIAVFRALALTGRTTARRVRLETVRGIVPVQEEVFRKPSQAQVWIELELPTVTPSAADLSPLLSRLSLPGRTRAWSSGSALLLDAGGFAAVRATRLEPETLRPLLPPGRTELVLFSTEGSSPFSDGYLRHVSTGEAAKEHLASVQTVAALGVLLWQEGLNKTFLSLQQGPDDAAMSRISVWIEGQAREAHRVSVGGQVQEIERVARSRP